MSDKFPTAALVILSGGQDSVTCLAWACRLYETVHAITFDYGQRHRVELKCAAEAVKSLPVASHQVLDVTALQQVAVSALTGTGDQLDVSAPHQLNAALPASYVPNRNAMFLTLAHAYAQTLGATILVTGVCETDYSGYPDCRAAFIEAAEHALNLGAETKIHIATPLMYKSKAEIWRLAYELEAISLVKVQSHTCYDGDRSVLREWGYGCSECPACKLRSKGWFEFMHQLNLEHDYAGGR